MENSLEIRPLNIKTLMVPIRGLSPLICHAWSEKAKKQMLDNMMKTKAKKRDQKDPEAEYRASFYMTSDGGYGFPAVAFKSSMVRAAKLAGIPMVDARQMFHVEAEDGDLVRIGGEPTMREDTVTVGRGTDLRYRPEFRDWKAYLSIRYNADNISDQQLVDLLGLAGFSVGVGEWRPEKSGQFGMFEVVPSD